MEDLTNESYAKFIESGNAVIDFWAEWCGPCKMLSPIMEELSKEVKGVKFGKLNVDDYGEIAGEAAVRGIPTLILFREGEEIDRIVGFQPKDTLKSRIEGAFR